MPNTFFQGGAKKNLEGDSPSPLVTGLLCGASSRLYQLLAALVTPGNVLTGFAAHGFYAVDAWVARGLLYWHSGP